MNQESGIRNQESGIRNQESLASLASISRTSTSRSAFTMIELVFIIVILGILGAIAVPKMAASRDDAQIVAIKQDVATMIQALPAYAMSQGVDNLTKFSDAVTLSKDLWEPIAGGGAYLSNADDTFEGAANLDAKRKVDGVGGCLSARLKNNKDLEIWIREDQPKCAKLGKSITIPLTGESVKF